MLKNKKTMDSLFYFEDRISKHKVNRIILSFVCSQEDDGSKITSQTWLPGFAATLTEAELGRILVGGHKSLSLSLSLSHVGTYTRTIAHTHTHVRTLYLSFSLVFQTLTDSVCLLVTVQERLLNNKKASGVIKPVYSRIKRLDNDCNEKNVLGNYHRILQHAIKYR